VRRNAHENQLLCRVHCLPRTDRGAVVAQLGAALPRVANRDGERQTCVCGLMCGVRRDAVANGLDGGLDGRSHRAEHEGGHQRDEGCDGHDRCKGTVEPTVHRDTAKNNLLRHVQRFPRGERDVVAAPFVAALPRDADRDGDQRSRKAVLVGCEATNGQIHGGAQGGAVQGDRVFVVGHIQLEGLRIAQTRVAKDGRVWNSGRQPIVLGCPPSFRAEVAEPRNEQSAGNPELTPRLRPHLRGSVCSLAPNHARQQRRSPFVVTRGVGMSQNGLVLRERAGHHVDECDRVTSVDERIHQVWYPRGQAVPLQRCNGAMKPESRNRSHHGNHRVRVL